MKRLIILACLALAGCMQQTVTKVVNVDCGGFTMDGNYVADIKVITDHYDVDKGDIKDVVRTTEQTFTSRVVFYSSGCASTFLDVGFHKGFTALEVDVPFNRPFDSDYNYNTKILLQGTCNLDKCEIAASFTDEFVGDTVIHIVRTWKVTDLEKWEDSPYSSVPEMMVDLDHIPFGPLDFPVEGAYE